MDDDDELYFDASKQEPILDYFSSDDWEKLRQAGIIYSVPDKNSSDEGWRLLRVRSVTIKEARELGLTLLK